MNYTGQTSFAEMFEYYCNRNVTNEREYNEREMLRWLKQQLQQAHRSGWEQCQREAKEIANGKPKQWLDKDFVVESAASAMSKEIADAIAAMEYTHKEG